MRKQEYNTVLVTLSAGQQSAQAEFPTINGNILGFGTHTTGDTTGKRVALTLLDGGQETHRLMSTQFSETQGRSSFQASLVPLEISNPGKMTASVRLDAPLAAGETIKVEVMILSQRQNIETDNC